MISPGVVGQFATQLLSDRRHEVRSADTRSALGGNPDTEVRKTMAPGLTVYASAARYPPEPTERIATMRKALPLSSRSASPDQPRD